MRTEQAKGKTLEIFIQQGNPRSGNNYKAFVSSPPPSSLFCFSKCRIILKKKNDNNVVQVFLFLHLFWIICPIIKVIHSLKRDGMKRGIKKYEKFYR